jgi:hypothetical protein
MSPDIIKSRAKQSAIAVLVTHKPSAVIAQQPGCDPRLTIPVTTIECHSACNFGSDPLLVQFRLSLAGGLDPVV